MTLAKRTTRNPPTPGANDAVRRRTAERQGWGWEIHRGSDKERERQQNAQRNKGASEIAAEIRALKPQLGDTAIKWATLLLLIGTTIFTGLSWLEFKGQLAEMKGASEQTNRIIAANETLAQAARDSADVARQAQTALAESQRATISYKAINLTFSDENSEKIEHWTPVWKNSGATQTRGLRTRIKCVYSEGRLEQPFDLTDMPAPNETLDRQTAKRLGKHATLNQAPLRKHDREKVSSICLGMLDTKIFLDESTLRNSVAWYQATLLFPTWMLWANAQGTIASMRIANNYYERASPFAWH
jgi:hypothetical protein